MQNTRETGQGELLFALDIGTRSVTGVVAARDNTPDNHKVSPLRVLHVETVEHTHRAVVDGQIEDIEQTAQVARLVKERLEAKTGTELSLVHVAAAGRVLRTQRATYELEVEENRLIEPRQVTLLESQAVQLAYETLLEENHAQDQNLSFYSVGHSVVRYTLDGHTFSTLQGHRGKRATVELIATFLPSEVVESLYTTMRLLGLGVASVTLEPIAAINAVIPKELRLLNIALVDVGAGTSDIAIADKGSVCAYTMATVAGDEITERIMQELLVDFEVAEQAKFALSAGEETIPYTDILGNQFSIAGSELLERIAPAVDNLARTIKEKILEANVGAPMAVFVVGGGSRTPLLCKLLAEHLEMEENKVAIGGNNYMKRLIDAEEAYLSAEYATPMGIALTAMSGQGQESFTVLLNGKPMRLHSTGALTIMEVLLRGGYQYHQIMGRSGGSVTYEHNGEKRVLRGSLPTLANIRLGGKLASITTPLQAGDEIEFEPAVGGADAEDRVEKVVSPWYPFQVTLDGQPVQAGTVVTIDGQLATEGTRITQMAKLEERQLFTLAELLNDRNIDLDDLEREGKRILVGGKERPARTTLLEPDDIIEIVDRQAPSQPEPVPVGAGASLAEAAPQQLVLESAFLAQSPQNRTETAPPQEKTGSTITVTLNGTELELEAVQGSSGHFYYDVLSFVEIDPKNPQGNIVTLKNGRDASYIEPIHDGDVIEVYWNK